jgi:EAL domain-containing protein (putative c-di-GMP-specific phosphodiesterase class I)
LLAFRIRRPSAIDRAIAVMLLALTLELALLVAGGHRYTASYYVGLFVAIDDFGTGFSSLSYLNQLTVDVIKIDRSFVNGLPQDERDGAIVEMLLRITDRFGFGTLAEGIETEDQARWLLDHGCRFGQGYLVAKPGSLETLHELLLSDSAVA